jgi:ferredoxin-nitrate reductase
MAGATSARLRTVISLQWPCPTPDHPGSKRRYLYKRFATESGRALFLPRDHRQPRELPDHEFPFVLTTGRLYAHWHTLTRTAKAEKLRRRAPGPFVEINPTDALRLELREGELVQISSRRGTIQLPARLRSGVALGMVFVPFHWGDLYGEGNAANYLTISAIGRVAKQPELKYCAVNLERVVVSPQAPRFVRDTLRAPAAAEVPSRPHSLPRHSLHMIQQ